MTIGIPALLTFIVAVLWWFGRVEWWVALICMAAGASGGVLASLALGLTSGGASIFSQLVGKLG